MPVYGFSLNESNICKKMFEIGKPPSAQWDSFYSADLQTFPDLYHKHTKHVSFWASETLWNHATLRNVLGTCVIYFLSLLGNSSKLLSFAGGFWVRTNGIPVNYFKTVGRHQPAAFVSVWHDASTERCCHVGIRNQWWRYNSLYWPVLLVYIKLVTLPTHLMLHVL